MKVLLVDDDPVVRILVGEYLTAKGHQVETRVDGTSALEHLKSEQGSPDIIILDFMMPGMNGAEVLQNLRESNATLPVVMLSADKHNLEGMDESSKSVALEKPFALDKLEAVMHRLVD